MIEDGQIWWSEHTAIQSLRNKKALLYGRYIYLLRVVFFIKFLQKFIAETRASSCLSYAPIKADTPSCGDKMLK